MARKLNTSNAGAWRQTKDITGKSGSLTFMQPRPLVCMRAAGCAPKGAQPVPFGSDGDDAVVVSIDPDGERAASCIAVGVGDLGSEVEFLVGRRLRLNQGEAADI